MYKRRNKQPVKSGDVLKKVFAGMGLEQKMKEFELFDSWAEIVGEKLAPKTFAYAIEKDRTLVVGVKSAVLANELQFLKRELTEKFNAKAVECLGARAKQFSGKFIADISFRLMDDAKIKRELAQSKERNAINHKLNKQYAGHEMAAVMDELKNTFKNESELSAEDGQKIEELWSKLENGQFEGDIEAGALSKFINSDYKDKMKSLAYKTLLKQKSIEKLDEAKGSRICTKCNLPFVSKVSELCNACLYSKA